MAKRLAKSERRRYNALAKNSCKSSYGFGPTSAWAHMSDDQRNDALMAEAAKIVLMQAAETGERLTFGDAQDMLLACIGDEQ